MGFLDGLLETKVSRRDKGSADSITRATGSAPVSSGQGLGNVGSWDIDKATQAGYERVIWIWRCVDVIAQNQASISIDLVKGMDRRGGERIENERAFRLLNFRANPYESSWHFRYRLSSQLLLSRRGAFIEVVPGKDGFPSELHLLPVGRTKPIPDPKTFVSGYEVTGSDNKSTILKPEQVIWLRGKPHPIDPYAQMTPLVAAGIEADTDFLARSFNRNFLSNDGRPGMLVTVDPGQSPMTPGDIETLKKRFSGGAAQAGITTVIEGAGISAQDMSASPRDTQWSELLQASKERILMSFGVPESVMGNASGRTFDNADAERENFWLDTMVPHCDNLAFGLDALSGDNNDDQVFAFRYDEVDVLQRMATRRREEWRQEVTAGLRTVDEYFEAVGREPWNRVETRILMNSNGVFTGRNDEDSKAAKTINPQAPQPAAAPGAGASSGQLSALNRATAKWGNQIAARALAIGKDAYGDDIETKGGKTGKGKCKYCPSKATRCVTDAKRGGRINVCPKHVGMAKNQIARHGKGKRADRASVGKVKEKKDDHDHATESYIEGVLESWDTRQGTVIPERLLHVKARKGTRHWEGEQKAATRPLDAKYVVDVQMWASDAMKALRGRLGRTYRAAAHQATRELREMGVVLPPIEESSVDASVSSALTVAENSLSNQMKRLQEKIAKMEADGATLAAIDKEVRRSIGARSSWRKLLATNLSTLVREQAKYDVNSRSSATRAVWRSSHDERVRTSHRALDGKSRNEQGVFVTPTGATLRFPGDPAAPISETVNCRCYLSWELDYTKFR